MPGLPEKDHRMEGLAGEGALQIAAVNQLAKHLGRRGRTAVVWDDGLSADLDPDVVVLHWRAQKKYRRKSVEAINRGRQGIMQPFFSNYFDWPHGFVRLKAAYHLDPLAGIELGAESRLLGVQAALWTEYVLDRSHIDFSIFPRTAATAEVGWTASTNKDYSDFVSRWQELADRLDVLGVGYAPLKVAQPGLFRRLKVIRAMRKNMRFEQQMADTPESHHQNNK